MTVSTITARNVKAPNGSTTSFPFDFSFDVEGDLVVTRVVIATAVETLQTLTTDYTVTGGSGATGTIEMNTAPPGPALENLVIERATPKTQSVDYQPNDPFPAEVNETALDKLTRIEQETLDLVDRAVKLKKNSTLAGPTIPDPEVDKVLVGKSTTEFENKTISDLDPAVTALPLSITNGGTNAATIAAAQINLQVGGKGADIASANPLVLGTDGNYFDVTGSINFASITVTAGRLFILQFDGTPTLTHNSITFDLPGEANVTVVAGDKMLCFSTGVNTVDILHYTRADGTAVIRGSNGACQLTKSGANLLLSRFDGTTINIDGTLEIIPSSGPTLAATGLSVDTNHFIYAFMSGGTLTLEASTTARATDTTTGLEIKSGDSTRTLVGFVRVITGPAFVDTETQRFVRSWFNDPGIAVESTDLAGPTTTSTTLVELDSTKRAEWVGWANEPVLLLFCGHMRNDTALGRVDAGIGIDGITLSGSVCSIHSAAANDRGAISCSTADSALTEGVHNARMLGNVDANTGIYDDGNITGRIGGR